MKKLKYKIILLVLSVLFLVAVFEIIVYFFYIYKPANQIFGSEKSYLLEIPSASEILRPTQLTSQETSLADTPKIFSPTNLLNFQTILDKKIRDGNTFVKDVSISYILQGIVTKVVKSNDKLAIILTNSTGESIEEIFTFQEIERIETKLIILSIENPQVEIINLEEIIPGDRIIIKSSLNLLESETLIKNQIEVHRLPKPF